MVERVWQWNKNYYIFQIKYVQNNHLLNYREQNYTCFVTTTTDEEILNNNTNTL